MEKLRKINNTFIFLFIILLCFLFQKCASVPCSSYCRTSDYFNCINSPGYTCNNSACKPKYGITSQCYDCSGIDTGNYYTIDQSGNCLINQCIGDKILGDSDECTSYILPGNYYRLGDVYYRDFPPQGNTLIECTSDNICKCKQYYYKEMINGKIKYTCLSQTDLDSSSVYKFYNYKTQELFKDQCPEGYKIIKELTSGVKRCSDTCLDNEFYQRTTVSDITTEKCIDLCPNKKYIDNGIKTCVSSCPENTYIKNNNCYTLDQCAFYSGSKCYDSCSDTSTESPKKLYHNYGSKECINVCGGEYIYKDENTNTKICYKKEQCTFIDISSNICYHTSCPTSKFHNFDSNICKTGCIDNDRKYHTLNEKICYPSCIDIPGRNHIYELDDYTCKKSSELGTNECPYYHINNYGVRKCFSFDQCIDNGYKYIIENKECRDNCEGYYKLDKTTSSSPSKPYVQCYENLDAVKRDSSIKYYHIKIKKCWMSFPEEYNYYIKGQTSYTQKELVDECEKFYYEKFESSKTRFYCIDDCQNTPTNKYFVSGNKKCFDNCINAYKYYYYPDNKECFDSCELKTDKPFSEPLSTTLAQECKASCGTNKYYNFDSHICLNNCGADRSINVYHSDATDNTKYICYPSCSTIPGSYLYEVTVSGESICKSSPSGSECKYYYIKDDGVKKCDSTLNSCVNIGYLYLIGNECKKICDSYHYKLEYDYSGNKFMRCFLTPNDCLNHFSGTTTTKIYYNEKLKQCWAGIPSENYYINKTSTNTFELVEKCDFFYYEDSTDHHNYCIEKCKTVNKYFLNGNQKCINDCKDMNKYYFDPDTNECLDTCEGRAKRYQNPIDTSQAKECLNSCTDIGSNGRYYNHDSNICLQYCGADNSNKKYHLSSGYICYSSCSDINNGEYKYEIEHIHTISSTNYKDFNCYTTIPSSCIYYYIKNDGTMKCVTNNDCKNMNYKYLKGKECRDKCDDNDYKLEKSDGFIYCYGSEEGCSNNQNIYYNIQSKTCWTQFPNYLYIKSENSIGSTSYKKYEVIEECPDFYYEEVSGNHHKICTNNCKTISLNLFFVNGKKRCEASCLDFNPKKYYYDPDTHECLDTCEGISSHGFQNPKDTSTAQSCLSDCFNDNNANSINLLYHNYDSNKCISHCGADNSNKKYHKESGYICYSSCSEIPGNYKYELENSNVYTCYINDPTSSNPSDCQYYIMKNDGTKRCQTDVICKSMNYIYLIGNECKDRCEGYYKYSTNDGFIHCFLTPDECYNYGTTPPVSIYYEEETKKCWKTFPEGDYYIKSFDPAISPPKYELVRQCEYYYYKGDTLINGAKRNFCVDKCESSTATNPQQKFYVSGNKKCLEKCDDADKYYYYYYECLDTCEIKADKPFSLPRSTFPQECKAYCDYTTYKYYDYNSHTCLDKCSVANSYHKIASSPSDGTEYICYPSCSAIPDLYLYEIYDTLSVSPYTCKNSITGSECKYFYMKDNGIKKCDSTLKSCIDANYLFVTVDECKTSCDDNKYQLEITVRIGLTDYKYTECLNDINECKSKIDSSHNLYYNIQSKNCYDNLIPEDYKYINNKDDTNKKYEVVKECEYFYYEEGTAPNIKKYCTSECKNSIINKYFIHSQKKCENSCIEFNKHYYDPTNNECLDSCKNLPNYEFAYQVEVSTPVQECREKCDLLTDASGNHKYYDYDSNICINQCGQNDANKKVRAKDGQICYISCDQIPGGQYIYELYNICYQNYADIPSDCDYYYIKPNGIKQCTAQAKCINENIFLYFVDKECRENCDGYYKYEDSVIISGTTKKYYKCFESKEKALSDNNCIYYNIKSKLCWRNFPEGYFINQEEISHTINRYEVVEECPYFYHEISVPTDTSKKCGRCTDLNKCEVTGNTFKYFTKGQKKCEDSCTKFNPIKYYYNSETYECLDTCEEFPGKEFANQISSSPPIQPCISECTGTDIYYDYDSKICFGKCGNGNPNYLYHTKDSTSYDPKDYKCYPSCKDIKIDNYLYQYKDTVDPNIKICSKTIPSTGCPYYYKNIDGTLECLPDANACLEMRYNYLLGQECKSECNDFYKLEDDTTTGLIKCFETKDKCLNTGTGGGGAKYFNIKLKKCWINFPQQYFVKDYTATTQIEVLEECEYYYYQDNASGEDIYYCIDECKSKSLYFNSGNKKCESSCTVFSMHYYIENKNECLETCEGSTGLEFANYIDLNINLASNQTPCKSKCNMNTIPPLTDNYIYFYYGSKTCRTSCGGSNKFIITYDTSVIDQDIICYSSCSEIPGGIYRYEYVDESSATPEYKCFKEEEIAEGQPSESKCPFYYSQGDGSMKCVLNLNECKTEGFNYYLERECLQNCDNYYKFMDEGIDTIECFRDLQNAFNSPKNIKFYERATKRVWKDIPSNYFVLYDIDTDRHEIIETCENYYYTKAPNNWNYCRDNCTTFGLFFDIENSNKKCESSCTDFTPSKLYYDANTLECLTTCIGNTPYSYPIDTNNPTRPCVSKCQNYFITKIDNQGIEHKECVDTCPVTDGSTTYDIIDKKTKECVTSCLPTQIEVDSKCYPKCDYDNGEIYINTDNYECETSCPPGLRNMILLTTNSDGIEIYLCKSFCDENKFRLEDKCLEKCPEGFNYIGHGNICKENCRTDPNGEYYYRVNDHVAHDHLIYKCINNCDEASITDEITSTIITFPYHSKKNNECHSNQCPTYAPHFISSQPYDCLDKCPDEFPFYDKANSNYECIENTICTGSDEFYFDGECFNDCGSRMYYDTKKICLDKCRDKEIKQLEGTRYICKEACEHYIYFESELDDLSCVIDCPEDKRFIGKNDICKKSCDEEDGINYYKYPVVDTTLSYIIYKCVSGCEGEHDFNLKLINNGPECYHTCPSNYPYLSSEENLCYDDCLKSSQNPFTLISGIGAGITKICTTIIECENSGKKYYGENKICLSNCNELGERYLMNYDNTCVLKCDLTSTYKFQLVNQCTDKCLAPNIRYSTNDYICKDKCGINEDIVTDNNECINTCDKFINAINSDEYKCIDSCASIDKFYYETETKKKCLHECYSNDKIIEGLNKCIDTCDNLYINDNRYYLCEDCGEKENPETLTNYIYDKCVTTCPDEKPYIDIELNKCIDICPIDKRYFVKNYIHSGEAEIKTKNVCLNDCPIEYPYYTITKDSLNRDIYECSNICNGYFVPNEDSNIIGKLCVNSCTKDDTQYKYKIEEEIDNILFKKCYERCPTEYKYHFDISMSINTDNTCYKQCLESAPYHKKGETICLKLSELIGGFLLLEEKEWTNDISACPSSYKYKSKVTNGVIICLNECISNDLGGIYLTPYKTCVTTCSTSDPLSLAYQKNLMNDELNQKCVCRNLYYISDSNFEIVCYEYSLTSCKDTTDGHTLPLYGTKQCLKTCIDDRILSPSEDICYDKNYSCPVNTEKITKSDGQKKCECKYKYYYQDTAKTIKICLGENDICPEPHIYYNTETKECASECSSEYLIFKNFCVKDCPKGTTKSGNTCDCGDRFWYQISEGNFECLIGACLDDFPLYSAENKECLKSCKNTYFPYLFENKCYRDCYPNTRIPNLETINIDSPLAEHECYCPSPWYYDNNHIVHCPTFGSIYKCRDYTGINKEYMIEETKSPPCNISVIREQRDIRILKRFILLKYPRMAHLPIYCMDLSFEHVSQILTSEITAAIKFLNFAYLCFSVHTIPPNLLLML